MTCHGRNTRSHFFTCVVGIIVECARNVCESIYISTSSFFFALKLRDMRAETNPEQSNPLLSFPPHLYGIPIYSLAYFRNSSGVIRKSFKGLFFDRVTLFCAFFSFDNKGGLLVSIFKFKAFCFQSVCFFRNITDVSCIISFSLGNKEYSSPAMSFVASERVFPVSTCLRFPSHPCF